MNPIAKKPLFYKYSINLSMITHHHYRGYYQLLILSLSYNVLQVLECPPGSNAFGRIDVYSDRLSLVGFGEMFSHNMRMERRAHDVT